MEPLVVCYGLGVDSTAVLVGLHQRGQRPDLVIFADVGAERPATMAYLAVINEWLESVGFPLVTVVRYQPKDFKHWPEYHTIEENVMTNISLPAIAYGGHSCSKKWKIHPQITFLKTWQPAVDAWARAGKIIKAVGFEDNAKERRRTKRCSTFSVSDEDPAKVQLWFPLQEWGWDRERCVLEIERAGLPVPPKSSCYFCTAMKAWEVDELVPDQLCRIVILEARTTQRHLEFAEAKGWPRGVGVPLTEGIWRKRVKGIGSNGKPNGAFAKPGSMTEYIRTKGLLPSAQVDALIALTPTDYFHKEDFEREGIRDWQDWIARIIAQSETVSAIMNQ